jgi:hypothetical protein
MAAIPVSQRNLATGRHRTIWLVPPSALVFFGDLVEDRLPRLLLLVNEGGGLGGRHRIAHPTRWNLRPFSGLEIIERSRLQGGDHHAGNDRILPAEGGGIRSTGAGSRRQRHARAFSEISKFMAERGETIRILARGRFRPDPAVAAVVVLA